MNNKFYYIVDIMIAILLITTSPLVIAEAITGIHTQIEIICLCVYAVIAIITGVAILGSLLSST